MWNDTISSTWEILLQLHSCIWFTLLAIVSARSSIFLFTTFYLVLIDAPSVRFHGLEFTFFWKIQTQGIKWEIKLKRLLSEVSFWYGWDPTLKKINEKLQLASMVLECQWISWFIESWIIQLSKSPRKIS